VIAIVGVLMWLLSFQHPFSLFGWSGLCMPITEGRETWETTTRCTSLYIQVHMLHSADCDKCEGANTERLTADSAFICFGGARAHSVRLWCRGRSPRMC